MKTLNKMLLIALFGFGTYVINAKEASCTSQPGQSCSIKWIVPGTDQKGDITCSEGSTCQIGDISDNAQVTIEHKALV